MTEKLFILDFSWPYSWCGRTAVPCVFEAEISRKMGIYLWTVHMDGSELIYYVGETGRDFGTRMLEHFREHCSGGYHIYTPPEFRRGVKIPLWTTIGEFLERASELWPAIVELAGVYRFFCAPLESDRRTRERIEAAIARHLQAQEGLVGGFQDNGIRYRGRIATELPIPVEIRCCGRFHGLQAALQA